MFASPPIGSLTLLLVSSTLRGGKNEDPDYQV